MKANTVGLSQRGFAKAAQFLFVFATIFSLLLSSVQSVFAVPADPALPARAQAQATCPCSIWPDPVTPSMPSYDNPLPVEVGLKFRSDTAGYVYGVRFFKTAGATGTHIGRLWSMNQVKLAEVTFTGETASGWQEAQFPNPVLIAADTTYIISYYVADGNRRFSDSQNFFSYAGVDNSPLHALAAGVDGLNGVYSDNGSFFGQSYLSSNYWVDLIFDTAEPPADTTPPTVSSVAPLDGATGVLRTANVSALFSERMDAATIDTSRFELRDSLGSLVSAAVTYNAGTYTAVLDPTADLSYGEVYTARVTTAAHDLAGNALAADHTWSFTTELPDTTPPEIISVSPLNGAIGVLRTANISATFSEAMDPATIAGDNFELRDSLDSLVAATVTYNAVSHSAMLDPAADLDYNQVYTARVTASVTDVAGNALAAEQTWMFTTELPDTTPPTISSVAPLDGASGVLVMANISATFNEAVAPGTINAGSFELRDPGNNVIAAAVTYDPGTRTAVLNPADSLAPSTVYTARITTAVTDVAGNPLEVEYTWSFTTEAPDATAPVVSSVKPVDGVSRLRLATKATVYFNEAMDPASISASAMELRDGANNLVAAAVTYDSPTNSAVLDPDADLNYATTYTVTVFGGASGVKDISQNPMAANYTWSFSTIAQRPPVDQAPGGPILILTTEDNLFTRYYAEIIRTEGFNAFSMLDIEDATAEILDGYDIVILGDMALTTGQVALLTDWVTAGGNLVAMRPDKQLAGLLGLADAAATLADAYLLIDTATTPGSGIVGQTLQFHGTADLYTLNGATSLAALYSNLTTATTYPAITINTVGTNGGQAAAFTFDLARSIVYTHQGNPAWQTGHVNPYQGYGTALDLFSGWIDFNRINIPQADEQQRFLANLLYTLNADEKPLPRFWYFPSGKKAAIILTGDDHIGRGSPSGSSAQFFDRHVSQSPSGCSVEDWECVRSSSYGYVGNTISDAQYAAYTAQGFEFGLHADAGLASGGGWCGTWPADMRAQYTGQYNALFDKYASLPVQSSERSHCYSWFGYGGPESGGIAYAATPEIEADLGIRLDTNISYNPGSWATVNPGYEMGSGMLMRMAQVDSGGTMRSFLDIYNGGTQMNDDNGQGAAAMRTIVDSFLDAAIGPQGYYGAFVVNMHSDNWYGWSYAGSDQIVASAQTRNIPVVSGAQMVEWLDGRNSSSFSNITWDDGNGILSFGINPGAGARNLRAMLPASFGSDPLSLLALADGTPVAYTLETVKGIQYAFFTAQAGDYRATYAPDTFAPVITDLAAEPAVGGTAEITWTTNEASSSRVDYGTQPDALSQNVTEAGLVTQHAISLSGLLPKTTYYYRVASSDESGNTDIEPETGNPPASFITPSAAFIDTTTADFSAGSLGDNTSIRQAGNGEVMLKPSLYAEFTGTALPDGWSGSSFSTGGTYTVASNQLTLDGARAGSVAVFGPGHSVEAVATFNAVRYQHIGFGVTFMTTSGEAWAIISTGAGGDGLYARTWTGTGAYDTQSTPIPGSYFGAPHAYRVDWLADRIDYYIDGELVASHALALTIPMRPLFADSDVGGQTLVVDRMYMGPYAASGQFTSRVLDALGPVADGTIAWDAVTPENTSLDISLRTGNTPVPDASWSAFAPVEDGDPIGSGFRYVQYQASLATTNTVFTPVLEEVRILYNAGTDTVAPQITSRVPAPGAVGIYYDTDVTVTFSEPLQAGMIDTSTFRLREVGATEDVLATVVYSGITATLHPLALLTPNREYQVTVAGTIADLSGNPLGADDTWTFSVIAPPGPPWMDTSWGYRREVTIQTSCAQVQTEYPVKIVLDSAFDFALAKLDGGDLRVTTGDGVTQVPFWIERWGTDEAVIWARPATLPLEETSLFLYYGNPAATAAGDASAVFSFTDQFSGSTLDLTKWTVANGSASQASFADGVMT